MSKGIDIPTAAVNSVERALALVDVELTDKRPTPAVGYTTITVGEPQPSSGRPAR